MAQRKQRSPLLGDIRETNRVVRQAQKGKDYGPTYPRLAETWEDLVLLVFHDAAWANVPATNSSPDVDEGEATPGMGIYSQLGHMVVLTSKRVLRGERGPGLLCTWKSHACPRVCRSTFAAETMSALEGFEDAIAFRSMLMAAIDPRDVGEARARQLVPVVALTDCKSVYDAVHRVGGPRAPTEKRLVVDLAGLRQMIHGEQEAWHGDPDLERCLRWIPTEYQLADALTKLRVDVSSWWESLRPAFWASRREENVGSVKLVPTRLDAAISGTRVQPF